MIKINTFKEKIYGNMATVYHRTSVSDLINKVYTSGFKPGSGDMYGAGFYSTYELESQYQNLERSRRLYGNMIVKFAVPIQNFLILDYEEFKKSPQYKKIEKTFKSTNHVVAQLRYFMDKNFDDYRLESLISNSNYTSDIAYYLYNTHRINRYVEGIIFTGKNDGKVLVCYDTNLIMPIAYKIDTEKEFQKVDRNMDYLRKVVKNKLSPHKIEPQKTKPHWIKKADILDGEFQIEKDSSVIWKRGIWKNGTWEGWIWEGGTWERGIWERGIWVTGKWKEGIWKGGTWKIGIWEDGTWKIGTWKDGTWKYGTWVDGLWNDGTWKDGTWENGTWESGTWKIGIWENGLWKDGTWESGLWRDGIWKDGTWKEGTWKDGTWESGTWVDGFWKYGTWDDGFWKNGIWKNGIWENGTWENGTWEDGIWKIGIWRDGKWKKGLWKSGTWKGGQIWNPIENEYQFSKKNPNETEWSLSYGKT